MIASHETNLFWKMKSVVGNLVVNRANYVVADEPASHLLSAFNSSTMARPIMQFA
jgi:hypothetical protein